MREVLFNGYTNIPEDPKECPVITLSADIPLANVLEIYAHELAHLAGNREHNMEWKKTFDRIGKAFQKKIIERTQKGKE